MPSPRSSAMTSPGPKSITNVVPIADTKKRMSVFSMAPLSTTKSVAPTLDVTCALCGEQLTNPVQLGCNSHHACLIPCLSNLMNSSRSSDGHFVLRCPKCPEAPKLVVDSFTEIVVNDDLKEKIDAIDDGIGGVASAGRSKNVQLLRCDQCQDDGVVECVQCGAVFCEQHDSVRHTGVKTSLHTRNKIDAKKLSSSRLCPLHDNEILKLYCKKDNELVCNVCVVTGDHKGHETLPVDEAWKMMHASLMTTRSQVRTNLENKEQLLKTVIQKKQDLVAEKSVVQQNISAACLELAQQLEIQRQNMVDEANRAMNERIKRVEGQVKELDSSTEVLQAGYNSAQQAIQLSSKTEAMNQQPDFHTLMRLGIQLEAANRVHVNAWDKISVSTTFEKDCNIGVRAVRQALMGLSLQSKSNERAMLSMERTGNNSPNLLVRSAANSNASPHTTPRRSLGSPGHFDLAAPGTPTIDGGLRSRVASFSMDSAPKLSSVPRKGTLRAKPGSRPGSSSGTNTPKAVLSDQASPSRPSSRASRRGLTMSPDSRGRTCGSTINGPPTFDPQNKSPTVSLTQGNVCATGITQGGWSGWVGCTYLITSGKHAFQVKWTNGSSLSLGVHSSECTPAVRGAWYNATDSWMYHAALGTITQGATQLLSGLVVAQVGQSIGIMIDMDHTTLIWEVDGTPVGPPVRFDCPDLVPAIDLVHASATVVACNARVG